MSEEETSGADEYDSPWKEALERYFPEFLALLFPEVQEGIDWSRGYQFLDTELQQVVRDADSGRTRVDKLVQVWRHDGADAWVLVHVEVQSQPDAGFAERMYRYNYRLFDRYERQVASLAVLGDETAGWRPAGYGYNLWGTEVSLRFATTKLLDLEQRWPELEASSNPFAVLVMAHLRTQSTRRQPQNRFQWKLRIVRSLYDRGYNREQVLEVFRFIDWMMALPTQLTDRFEAELEQFEQERKMPYVTSIERRATERGREEGLSEGLRAAVRETLELRFRALPPDTAGALAAISDPQVLRDLHREAVLAENLEAFQASLGRTLAS